MSSTQESAELARSGFANPRRWTSILRKIGIRSPGYPPVVEALEGRLLMSRGPDHSGVLASVARSGTMPLVSARSSSASPSGWR